MYEVLKKFLYAFLVICISASCVFAYTDSEYLSKIEDNLYHTTYEKDSIQKRLVRIEKSVYGGKSKLSNIQRIQRLKSVFVYTPFVPKEPNIIPVNNQTQHAEYGNYPLITKMENLVFNSAYENEDIYQRLGRLEMTMFNQTSSKPLMDRVDTLQAAIIPSNQAQQPKLITNQDNEQDVEVPYDNKAALSELENLLYKTTYPTESNEQRLERLEMTVFKNTSTGDPENKRIERLAAVIQAESSSENYRDMSVMRQTSQTTKTITLIGVGLMILKGLLF